MLLSQRDSTMQKIILASNNRGKIKEIQALLKPLAMTIIPQQECAVTEIAETGLTFVENALLKARHACQKTQLPTIADDSGLVVPALQGQPGIHSSRYGGDDTNDEKNNQKLLAELSIHTDRRAYFYCCIVFMTHTQDPTPIVCTARWHGKILPQPQGEQGFGYDPIFGVTEHQCSAAQLDPATKNTISHRGQALKKLIHSLENKDD